MFCSKCGKQIPENTNFCNHCGAQQPASINADSVSKVNVNQQNLPKTQKETSKKAPKKKKNIVISLVAMLCAFLLGKFVIAPSMLSDSDNEVNYDNKTQLTTKSNDTTTLGASTDIQNSAYYAVLSEAHIAHLQPIFNTQTSNFVSKFENGIIFCSDYGYKDDVVIQIVETMYIPVTEMTDAQKTELENNLRTDFSLYESIECCTVKYEMGTNYFTVTTEYTNLDKEENYSALYEAKILDTNTYISMSATEKQLLEEGAIKE